MLSTRITFTLCAGLLAASACAHDQKKETARTQQTDVTRETASADPSMRTADQARASVADGTAEQTGACELAVYFDTNSARLDNSSQQRLDTVAECMKRREVDHATIVGQTDPSGTPQRNKELGLERAKAVAEYLRGRGVPDDQIHVRSRGEMAAAQSEELWPVERRAGVSVD